MKICRNALIFEFGFAKPWLSEGIPSSFLIRFSVKISGRKRIKNWMDALALGQENASCLEPLGHFLAAFRPKSIRRPQSAPRCRRCCHRVRVEIDGEYTGSSSIPSQFMALCVLSLTF